MRKANEAPILICVFALIFCFNNVVIAQASQTVTEIITNYNSYYKSGHSNFNLVKPDNSHELLAFTYKDVRYSTGVNDDLLRAHNEVFDPQVYKALPVTHISGTPNSNTKIGLGQMYDGVHNGPSDPPPANDMVYYLTDGTNGLDIGTGVANLPVGKLAFKVGSINPLAIGDGIPDIIITQFADPSAGVDKYEFLTENDVRVGKLIDISFSGIQAVANWTADFYEASRNPLVLTRNFTNTDRPLRLWAADFADFGITTSNFEQIKKFVINLNGNSDVAFVAYNVRSAFSIVSTGLVDFTSRTEAGQVNLNWKATSESTSFFAVERSRDGVSFSEVGRMPANHILFGNQYRFRDENPLSGVSFYRLRMYDKIGNESISQTLSVRVESQTRKLTLYPNPATSDATLWHAAAIKGDKIIIYDAAGRPIKTLPVDEGSLFTKINLTAFQRGLYIIRFFGKNGMEAIVVVR